ncbi:MAG TPA: hypothetical protein VF532_16080 [Candidatus Angelobacter sp.]
MNTSSVSSFAYQTAERERSAISKFSPAAGNVEVPPYFSGTTKWQVSTTALWFSYLKPAPASASKAAESAGMHVPPYFSQKPQISAVELWISGLKAAAMVLAKDFRTIQFRIAHNLQAHRG